MRVSLALLALLLFADRASAQVLDDDLVPRGVSRFEISPVFTSWNSRFGRTATGETRREALGEDLTATSAETLFPGAESLRSAIAAMSGSAAYTPVLGQTQSRVSEDVTRVEFGAHVGIFDWLTVGVLLPLTRTRTDLDVNFHPDTLNGDLGLNPTLANGSAVTSFLQSLTSATSAAASRAAQICAGSPGSGTCSSAQALADRAAAFEGSATKAYGASAFFPLDSTTTGAALAQALSTLSTDLVAVGLPGIGVSMPFASERVSEETFWSLPKRSGSRVLGAPLGSVRGIWQRGDVEISATVRILEGELRQAPDVLPSFTYRVLATALGRLPTGQVDSVDVFLDMGSGDGQADFEGRLLSEITVGRHLGLAAGARYGIQRPRARVVRIAPPEVVLAPASTRASVQWSPGTYFGVEISPRLRISTELTIAGEYRAFRKYRDEFDLLDAPASPLDPSVLEVESGVSLHEVGGSLRYDTLARWLGGGVRPMQVNFRVMRAVAGGGGQTPATTQVEFGARLFRRVWGTR